MVGTCPRARLAPPVGGRGIHIGVVAGLAAALSLVEEAELVIDVRDVLDDGFLGSRAWPLRDEAALWFGPGAGELLLDLIYQLVVQVEETTEEVDDE